MSKLGKKTIILPKDSTIKVDSGNLLISGPKSSKTVSFNEKMFTSKVNEKNEFQILPNKKTRSTSILWGTYRSLVNNAVVGVSKGHEKNLELNGVGFRANLKGQDLVLTLGFSHEVKYTIPKGITIKVEKQTKLNITGSDKELVSKVAADIKSLKPVEPYKAKGIKEKDQYVIRKEGKKK